MTLILIAIFSYLLGSIPFSYIIARAYGKNLYEIGSKNIGTANVYRATGKILPALLALIGDVGKGVLAISLTRQLGCLGYDVTIALMLAAFFVVLGHNWPIFLKLKGGRGLATLAGVLLALNWQLIVLAVLVIIFITLLIELIMEKQIKLEGSLKEKAKGMLSIIITQVAGRVVGIMVAAILVFILNPQTFKIASGAVILSGIKHIKRTKDFLQKQK